VSFPCKRIQPRPHRRGYILVMLSLSLVVLLGLVGLAVDVGRVYIAKSEAQSFVDAAALNAAVKLALSPGDFTGAETAAAQTPKKWQFGTTAFTDVVTKFGTHGNCCADKDSAPANSTFAQVTAKAAVRLYFLSPLVRSTTATVSATAVAGQEQVTTLPGGEFPFSPVSRVNRPDCPSDPFGFCPGQQYTLRWPPPGQGKKGVCGTDQWSDRGSWGQDWRGYCCVEGNGVPGIERTIMLGEGTVPLGVGDTVPTPPGQKEAIDIDTYVGYDSDRSSTTYADYRAKGTGNGKRIVVVPVNDPNTQEVVGFAAFFLPPSAGKFEICGEYIGSFTQGLPGLPPETGSNVWRLRLYK
jgi:Flp pilus assembly protein TadG